MSGGWKTPLMSWSNEPWRARSGRSTRGGESSSYSSDQRVPPPRWNTRPSTIVWEHPAKKRRPAETHARKIREEDAAAVERAKRDSREELQATLDDEDRFKRLTTISPTGTSPSGDWSVRSSTRSSQSMRPVRDACRTQSGQFSLKYRRTPISCPPQSRRLPGLVLQCAFRCRRDASPILRRPMLAAGDANDVAQPDTCARAHSP